MCRMQVSDSHKMLFVHVQKTGGSSLDSMLESHIPDLRKVRRTPDRHAPLSRILKVEPELVHYWTFGFVRNPWDRMVSWWSMIQQAKARDDERLTKLDRWKIMASYPDFEAFVMRGPEDDPAFRRPQYKMLTTKSRRADFIGRQETYADDVRAVFARLGLPVPDEGAIERRNVSHDRKPYRDLYTPHTRDRVAEVFKRDIEVFAYEF
jgi:hypothetical protein